MPAKENAGLASADRFHWLNLSGLKPGMLGRLAVALLSGLGLALGLATALLSMNQSLWLDELHTAWCSTGSWEAVAARAAEGNQLPTYFWWSWWLGRTLGYAEGVWRLTSFVAWLVALVIAAGVLVAWGRAERVWLWPLIGLVALDRSQLFYATEARPYALSAVVVLLAWLALDRARCCGWSAKWLLTATALDALAFWIQPTAVLHIGAQAFALLVVIVLVWRSESRARTNSFTHQPPRAVRLLMISGVCGLVMVLAVWPAVDALWPVWQRRAQWSSFASNLSVDNLLKQMPFATWVLPALLISIATQLVGLVRSSTSAQQPLREKRDPSQVWLWCCAWAMPLTAVVLLAACNVAPLVHQRYLLAAVFPMVLWSALCMARTDWPMLRAVAWLWIVASTLSQPNTFVLWQHGRLAPIVRGEDWRGAVEWIASQSAGSHEPVFVFCASYLIEGNQRQSEQDPQATAWKQQHREYLSLPLQTIYQLPGDQVSIVPLYNSPSTWQETLRSQVNRTDSSRLWLVARLSRRTIAARLEAGGLRADDSQPDSWRDFGGVQVVRLSPAPYLETAK